jgi:hypothetical protein
MKKIQTTFKLKNQTHVITDSEAAALIALFQRKNKGLTHLEFQDRTGSYRLSARIYDLRKLGLLIDAEWETENEKKYKRYYLRSAISDMITKARQ